MAEQNTPPLTSTEKTPRSLGNFFLYAAILMILMALIILMLVKMNSFSKKLSEVEQVSKSNDHQLIYLNQILGKSLEESSENISSSPIEIKDSLEAFEKLTLLASKIADLPIKPIDQTPLAKTVSEIKVKSQNNPSVNAEMRWWAQVGHVVFDPLKDFLINLVKIQVLDSSVDHLAMTAQSQAQLREELTIRILTSRALLLNGLIHQTSAEVIEITKSVQKNFAIQDKKTQLFLENLQIITIDLDRLDKKASQKSLSLGEKK
jgi:hypothetical protein